jgi:hypothetical protein
MDCTLTFNRTAREHVLALLDKTVDDEGFIVEKSNHKQRVLSFEGKEMTESEFGGVQKGSEVFISNNLVSLMRLTKTKRG